MKYKKIALITLASLGLGLTSNAQDGNAIFEDNGCAACHTIGGGKVVGPDLKGLHDRRTEAWVVSFVKDPNAFAETDADAKAIAEEFNNMMTAQTVSDDDIKAIYAYIGTQGSAAPVEEGVTASADENAEPEMSTDDATQEDIDKGRNLFTGTLAFDNGGVSCVTCHNVTNDQVIGGGRLAKDLTQAHGRMGDMGIKGILSSPPFPAMKTSYESSPLTEEEIYQLTSFLNKANVDAPYQQARSWDWVMVFGGGSLACFLIVHLAFIYGKRKTKSTKHDILNRQGYYDNK